MIHKTPKIDLRNVQMNICNNEIKKNKINNNYI